MDPHLGENEKYDHRDLSILPSGNGRVRSSSMVYCSRQR